MGVINKIFSGGGKALATPVEAVGNVVDKLFTSEDEKLSHKEVMERLLQRPGEVQAEINKLEAQHRSRFVAGWRPACGWVCAIAFAYNFVLRDILAWVMLNTSIQATEPPALAMEHLMTVLLGMLGLGAYRTFEKKGGMAK